MTNSHSNYRQALYAAILVLYLLPTVWLSKHTSHLVSPDRGWSIFSTGLLITIFGSLALILLIKRWETWILSETVSSPSSTTQAEDLQPYVEEPEPFYNAEKITPLHPQGAAISELQQNLDDSLKKNERLSEEISHYIRENKAYKQQIEQMSLELNSARQSTQEKLQGRESLLQESQQTLSEQRERIEQQQHLIAKLENKVRDLNYEIKTLLQLSDMNNEAATALQDPSPQNIHPAIDVFHNASADAETNSRDLNGATLPSSDNHVRTPYDASLQLQRCLDIATHFQGAAHLGDGSSRFRDLGVDNYTIDMRRLFDKFRSETSSAIVLYSPKSQQILFANNQVKSLLGWPPETLVRDFNQVIQKGAHEWENAVNTVNVQGNVQVNLTMKTKAGHDIPIRFHLGRIPTGIFAQHVVAILYPV